MPPVTKLFAVTMGIGGHFISALNLEKQLCSNPGLYILLRKLSSEIKCHVQQFGQESSDSIKSLSDL